MTRLRKPLVCAGLAAGLATTLVVTTPYVAEAFAGPALGALAKEGAAVAGAQFSGFIGMVLGTEAGAWAEKSFEMTPENPQFDVIDEKAMWGYLGGIFAPNNDISIPFAESPDMWDVNSSVWNGVPAIGFTEPGELAEKLPETGGATTNLVVSNLIVGLNTEGVQSPTGAAFKYTVGVTSQLNANIGAVYTGLGNLSYQCSGYGTTTKGQVIRSLDVPHDFGQFRDIRIQDPQVKNTTKTSHCPSGYALDWVQLDPPTTAQFEAAQAASGSTGQLPTVNSVIAYRPGYVAENPGYRTRVTCVNPATGEESYLWYTTPVGAGALVIPSCREAGKGTYAREIATDFVESGTVRRPMIQARPKEDPLVGDTQWTDCDPMFGPVCKMEIYIDGKKCDMLAPACVDWLQHHSVNPTNVECRYGGRVVHISYCYGMELKYRGHPVAQDPKNFDGNPLTSNPDAPTQPQVDPNKNPNYDPNDSPLEKPSDDPHEWKVPVPSPNMPNVETEGDTETPTDPNPTDPPGDGDPPGTGPGVDVANPPVAPPGTSTSCWGARASWNPIEWVYQPVVCAMQAVFQPTKPIQERVTSMSGHFSNKVPVSWFGMGTEGISGGACPTSWKVEFRGESHSLICGTAADGMIRSFRPVLGAMLVIAAVFPLMRSLFYSAIPLFRVTPS